MAYNKFRWYTNGRRKKPLKKSEPLLLRIRNGDFEYSPYFDEAEKMKEEGLQMVEFLSVYQMLMSNSMLLLLNYLSMIKIVS